MHSPNVIIVPDLEPTDTDQKVRMVAGFMGSALLAFGLYSCSTDDKISVSTPTAIATAGSERLRPTTLAELDAKIGDDAVQLMTRNEYPKMHQKLGARQFKAANDLTKWAARAAAEHGGVCDRVDLLGVSDRAARLSVVWYADCANGQRLFIDQQQAEDLRTRFAGKGK